MARRLISIATVSDAYKDNFISMNDKVRAKVVRPNGECLNGYVHLVDTVMLDDAPVWAVDAASSADHSIPHLVVHVIATIVAVLTTMWFMKGCPETLW